MAESLLFVGDYAALYSVNLNDTDTYELSPIGYPVNDIYSLAVDAKYLYYSTWGGK